MAEVLVLGNGISRLALDGEIRAWRGEMWACNRAYLDFPEQITRLTGHADVLIDAAEYRAQHGLGFTIWSGHLGRPVAGAEVFTCPVEYRKDSGTTLVAQALHEGHTVVCAGFDLGGPDIHSPGLEGQDKTNWVRRWRAIAQRWGLDRVTFWGHDHKPYIHSNRAPWEYARRYRAGKPHIADKQYYAVFEQFTGGPAVASRQEDPMVEVVYVKGPRAGFRTQYRESIANILRARGEIEIVSQPKEGPKVTAHTPVAELRAIAEARGIDHEGLGQKELYRALKEAE